MKKSKQVGLRWNPAIKAHWEKFARDSFGKESSVLAREILEEFLACFTSDDQLLDLGLAHLRGNRPGGLLKQAILRAKSQNVPDVGLVSKEKKGNVRRLS